MSAVKEPSQANDFDAQRAALLERVVSSLDALNSWVRSPSYRDAYWLGRGPMYAVYFYKGLALKQAADLMHLCIRRVKAVVKCRDCGGDGRYQPWWSNYPLDHCYACNSTGSAKLYFIETEFPFGVRWHTPRERFPWSVGDTYASDSYLETDWLPNQKGKDLTVAEAARHLNIAESYFTERPRPRHGEYETYDDANYVLHVGETDSRVCSFCGGEAKETKCCVRRGRVAWLDHMCEPCEKRIRASGEFKTSLDAFPPPLHLLERADIKAWMRRNFIGVDELRPKKAEAKLPF